jgi:hypothetical protein
MARPECVFLSINPWSQVVGTLVGYADDDDEDLIVTFIIIISL